MTAPARFRCMPEHTANNRWESAIANMREGCGLEFEAMPGSVCPRCGALYVERIG